MDTMDRQLIELYTQRGRLRERIRAQRAQLVLDIAPVADTLQAMDYAHWRWQQTKGWLAAHPMVVAVTVAALVLWRPRAVVGTLHRGYSIWRYWQRARAWMLDHQG
ncbi:MAG: hypothetical protein IPH35_19000 [Rhodoferax sp.]|nr:hypothetical protein [Rhodoferax sp.]